MTKTAEIHMLEPVTIERLSAVWSYRTNDALGDVLKPGYFVSCLSHGLRRLHRIQVICDGKDAIEVADLLITDAVRSGAEERLDVAVLWRKSIGKQPQRKAAKAA